MQPQTARLVQPALVLSPDTPLDQAIAAVSEAAASQPPQVDCVLVQSSRFLGIFSSQDAVRALTAGERSAANATQTLSEWMRSDGLCLPLDLLQADLGVGGNTGGDAEGDAGGDAIAQRIAAWVAQTGQDFAIQPYLPVINDQQQAVGVITTGTIAQLLLGIPAKPAPETQPPQSPTPHSPLPTPHSPTPHSPTPHSPNSTQFEVQFQEMIAQIPGLLYRYVLCPDGTDNFVYLSPGFRELCGYEVEAGIRDTGLLWTLVHPDDREASFRAMQEGFESQQSQVDLHYRIVRPDGEIRYLQDRISFCRNAAGQVTFYQGVVSDLTERRQTELVLQQLNQELEHRVQERTQALLASQEALNQREQALRSLVQNSPDLILRVDRDLRYLYVNPVLEANLQLPAAEILGKIPSELGAPPHLLSLWQASVDRAYHTRQQQQIEYRTLTARGELYYQSKIVPEFDVAGNVVSFLVVARDIGELKQIQADLQESENRFRQLAETVDDAFWLAEPIPGEARELSYLYVNSAFTRIWGRPIDLLYESGSAWFETIHPDDRDRVLSTLPQQLQENYDQEFRILRPTGEVRWVRDRTFLVYDEAGSLLRVAGIVEDITDRKQFEQKLQTAYRELEQRVEERTAQLRSAKEAAEAASTAKSTFLANMSHELRTPLNAILGFTQLLSRASGLTPDQYEQIDIINRSGEHLLSLINDILEMSKIEAGCTELNSIAFDLHQLLQSLHEMLRLRVAARRLELQFELDDHLPRYVEGDEGKLRQILINLLNNAIKFTTQGRVVLRVQRANLPEHLSHFSVVQGDRTLESTAYPSELEPGQKAFLCFQVEDTGSGIAPEEMDILFEPFVQTQSGLNSPEGGTGLGLPISREFARLMGGDLTARSVFNQGSIFTVYLPLTIAQLSNSLVPAKQISHLAANQPIYRILIAEDQAENRELLVTLLKQVGYAVAEAANGQEAIEQWRSWRPHLIFMDMRMPVMNGDRAVQEIRRLEEIEVRNGGGGEQGSRGAGEQGSNQSENPLIHPSTHPPLHSSTPPPLHSSTKIIALTANAFEEDREKMLAIGCDDFLPKPFDQEVLLERLAEHLEIEYVYTDHWMERWGSGLSNLIDMSLPPLTAEQLKVMPIAWIEQLHQFCIDLDSSAVLTLIDQIPSEYEKLADVLLRKVNEFQFEELMTLAEAAQLS